MAALGPQGNLRASPYGARSVSAVRHSSHVRSTLGEDRLRITKNEEAGARGIGGVDSANQRLSDIGFDRDSAEDVEGRPCVADHGILLPRRPVRMRKCTSARLPSEVRRARWIPHIAKDAQRYRLPPGRGVVAGFEHSRVAFAGEEVALMRYFGSTYDAKLDSWARSRPPPHPHGSLEGQRADVGIDRTNRTAQPTLSAKHSNQASYRPTAQDFGGSPSRCRRIRTSRQTIRRPSTPARRMRQQKRSAIATADRPRCFGRTGDAAILGDSPLGFRRITCIVANGRD